MYQFLIIAYLFTLRWRISHIANRYSKPNNKYITDFDPTKESTYLMYFDANNLYGLAMIQSLPTGWFKWATKEKVNQLNEMIKGVKVINKNTFDNVFNKKKGYILECSFIYPQTLQDLHSDYPVGAERVVVQDEWESPYAKNIKETFGLPSDKTIKLIPTLFNREQYVLHVKNLELYIELGIELTEIHRVIQFNESPWLAEYISFNTEK